jgi:hypothetical protein
VNEEPNQTENPYERQHRFFKAVQIVDKIEELGLMPFMVKQMDKPNRNKLAAMCELPPPSDETWQHVTELFSKRVVDPLVKKAAALSIGSACTPLLS